MEVSLGTMYSLPSTIFLFAENKNPIRSCFWEEGKKKKKEVKIPVNTFYKFDTQA